MYTFFALSHVALHISSCTCSCTPVHHTARSLAQETAMQSCIARYSMHVPICSCEQQNSMIRLLLWKSAQLQGSRCPVTCLILRMYASGA
eukprot:IDg18787t1